MLTFLLYTVVFILASSFFAAICLILIQPGQIFGGWQHIVNTLYQSESRLLNLAAKPLGECELCFCHFMSLLAFIGYVIFMNYAVGTWVTDGMHTGILAKVAVNVIWYFTFMSLATIVSLKIFNSRTNVHK